MSLADEEERAESATATPTSPLADSSGRSARSGVRAVLEKWRRLEKELRQRAKRKRKRYKIDHYEDFRIGAQLDDFAADIYRNCATDLEAALADAPPAAGERAIARNSV